MLKKTEFTALIKVFKTKALVSGDKGYEVLLQSHDFRMSDLSQAPANRFVNVVIQWEEQDGERGSNPQE